MTHLQNIPHILQHGITHISSPNRNPAYVSIGDSSLISVRDTFLLPNDRMLGSYIPFYFDARMPMLYVIQKGFNGVLATSAKDIVYCVSSVEAIEQQGLDYVFSDGHAIDVFTNFYTPADRLNIENLIDRKAIQRKYWNDENDLDLKRRKEAEFLVSGDIPTDAVLGFVVYNAVAEQEIQQMQGFQNKKLIIKPEYYF
ncbi:MAG TPA: DUF4433 domain-containing protein [Ferruginibacter sp.]|nr:DUF4433 domain-containing protein [Ferruginibacter sp.]